MMSMTPLDADNGAYHMSWIKVDSEPHRLETLVYDALVERAKAVWQPTVWDYATHNKTMDGTNLEFPINETLLAVTRWDDEGHELTLFTTFAVGDTTVLVARSAKYLTMTGAMGVAIAAACKYPVIAPLEWRKRHE